MVRAAVTSPGKVIFACMYIENRVRGNVLGAGSFWVFVVGMWLSSVLF